MPVLAQGFRYFGVAVAGQVDQVAVAAQAEEIDELRAPRLFANKGQAVVIGKRIQRAGFTSIGASGERDLNARGWRQIAQIVRRNMESGILKQRHIGFW